MSKMVELLQFFFIEIFFGKKAPKVFGKFKQANQNQDIQ
jgi:hypothetical protein